MKTTTVWIAVVAVAACVLGLSGCGAFSEANLHNAPSPAGSTDTRPDWHRIDSPPNYPTIVTSCYGLDGIYIDQDASNSVMVVANDPQCQAVKV